VGTRDAEVPVSIWRNDDVWIDRLREDRAVLEAQLSEPQDAAVRKIVDGTDSGGELEFLIVYGSVSRGDQRPDSDLDIYYETRNVYVELDRADPDSKWHVFGAPSGALLESLERGDEMAFDIVRDALIVYDEGLFRELIVAVDEEQLRPAAPPTVSEVQPA
jgi:predicted nucleotidyltransferase